MKRSPLRPVSRRTAAKRALRHAVVEFVIARDESCRVPLHIAAHESVWPVECAGPLEVHEVIPRSAWRDGELVESNCVLVCRLHHDLIGDNPAEAHRLGLHGFSWERPVVAS